MSRARQYGTYASAMVGQSVAQRLSGLVTSVVLARVLGATGLGVYSIVATTANSVYGIVRLGSEMAILVQTAQQGANAQERSRGELLGAGLFLLAVAAGVAVAGCLAFADVIAGRVFGDSSLEVWIRVAGVLTALLCLTQFCSVAMAGLQHFTSYAYVFILMAIVQAVVVTTGGILFGLSGAIVAMLGVQALTVAVLVGALRRALKAERVQFAFRNLWKWTRQLLSFGLPFHAAALVAVPVSYYLQGMLARQAEVEALGFLRIVVSLTAVVTFAPSSLATTVAVMLSAGQPGQFASDTMRTLKLVSLFCLLVAPVVSLALPWLIAGLFGPAYRPILGAAGIAMASAVLAAMSQVVEVALLSARRPAIVFVLTGLRMLSFLACGQFLIERFGLTGYLIADLSGHVVLLTVVYCCSRRWLQQNLVAHGWLAKVLLLWSLLLAYTAAQFGSPGTHSAMSVMIGLAVFVPLSLWGYHNILNRDDRRAVAHILHIPSFGAISNAAAVE